MRIKHVIFDLGAVMFDWDPEKISKSFTDDLDLQERIQSQLYYHQDWVDFDCGLITEKETIKRASNRLEISMIESEKLFHLTKESLTLISETFDVLKKVKEKKLNAYCLSNISPELFQHLFERHDLFSLFDGIVTSGVENIGKPNRQIFEIILERYQLKAEECLFIDDSVANTNTANNLGIQTITFKGSIVCYQNINKFI